MPSEVESPAKGARLSRIPLGGGRTRGEASKDGTTRVLAARRQQRRNRGNATPSSKLLNPWVDVDVTFVVTAQAEALLCRSVKMKADSRRCERASEWTHITT